MTNPWADLYWYRCTEFLRGELALLGHGGYRECYEMPRAMDGDGEPGAHLHGVPMHIAATIDQMRTEAVIGRHEQGGHAVGRDFSGEECGLCKAAARGGESGG